MGDVIFIRRRGKIIPIRKKDINKDRKRVLKGASKITGATGLALLAAKSATKDLKKSFSLFKTSSELRAISKHAKRGSFQRGRFIHKSAQSKIMAMKRTKIAKGKFGIGFTLASLAIGSGITDVFDPKFQYKDEISDVVTTGLLAGASMLVAKKFKVRAKNIDELFRKFGKRGEKLSRAKIKRISSAGVFPERFVGKGQLDLF